MKETFKRNIGTIMAVIMTFSSTCISVYASDIPKDEPILEETVSDTEISENAIETYPENSINVGDYFQMGTYCNEPILWRCIKIDENGPLMLSDKILCVKPFDAAGVSRIGSHSRGIIKGVTSGYYRREYGSNYWGDSNIRDWLNSDASAGNVVWSCGNPPDKDHVWNGYNAYDKEAGFLNGFTEGEKSAIKTVTQNQLLDGYEYSSSLNQNYYSDIDVQIKKYDTAYSETTTDKVFLLDIKQLQDLRNDLGDYFKASLTPEAAENSDFNSDLGFSNYWYWLRSPYCYNNEYGAGNDVENVTPLGDVLSDTPYNISGIRPAFYLNTDSGIVSGGSGSELDPYILSGTGNKNESLNDSKPVFTFTTNGEITRYTGPGGNISIPCDIEGIKIRRIGEFAFKDCTKLTIVTIPKEIMYICNNAFEGCSEFLVIKCYKNSYAYYYAKNNNIPFLLINDFKTTSGDIIYVGDYYQIGTYQGNPILWRCVSIDENGPLMLSDKILCTLTFDSGGENTSGSHIRGNSEYNYRFSYGSNYWGDSNIRDWLNSDASAGNVFWSCGNPPRTYSSSSGFLNGFTPDEKSAIKTVTQKQLLDGYEYNSSCDENYYRFNSYIYDVIQNYGTAYSETTTDKVFLLDVKQIFDLYYDFGDYHMACCTPEYAEEHKKSTTEYISYWLRTPYTSDDSTGYRVLRVKADGNIGITDVQRLAIGVRPAFYLNLNSATISGGSGSTNDPYILSGNGEIETEKQYYGDIDGNNFITASDATYVLQKTMVNTYELPIEKRIDDCLKYVDVDGDTNITANDAALIFQKALVSTFELPIKK